jgi:Zn-finger nucleic acid-binding protein
MSCVSCGGVFIRRERVAALLASGQTEGLEGPSSYRDNARGAAHPVAIDFSQEVRYLHCPICKSMMTRQNFARRSGVIVDVCPNDGTWFDGGEVERASEYIRTHGPVDPRKDVPPMSRPTRDKTDLLLDLFS